MASGTIIQTRSAATEGASKARDRRLRRGMASEDPLIAGTFSRFDRRIAWGDQRLIQEHSA